MTLTQAAEAQASEYQSEYHDFLAGWSACLAEIKRRIGEFDKPACIDMAKHEDSDGYFGFLTGAEWQHEQIMKVLE